MNENDDQILEQYVTKMLEIQQNHFEKPLSLEELKEVADSVGMSEADWNRSQEVMKRHLKTGQGHLKNQNWEDAINELEQALAIHPYHEELLYGLAKSHYELFRVNGNETHQTAAKAYADRALKNKDNHYDSATIALLNYIREAERQHKARRKGFYLKIAAGIGGLVVIMFIWAMISSGTVSGRANKVDAQMVEVNKQWGQVQNVYQRREAVVPKIEALVKAESSADLSKLNRLRTLQKQLDPSNREAYLKKQKEFSKVMGEVMSQLENTSEGFRTIQVTVEGAENRIRVEWRKYNNAVGDYNKAVLAYNKAARSFPASLFGYQEKEQIESQQVE